MFRRVFCLAFCGAILGGSVGVRGAEIILQPVSASGNHTIEGTEIRLESGGQRVRLEVQIRGFAPHLLKTYQARLYSAGYSNGNSVELHAAVVDCPSEDSAGNLFCRVAFNATGIGAPKCVQLAFDESINPRCEPGWINQNRTDWILFGRNSNSAVDISSTNFRWGGATYPGEEVLDDGLTYYVGTLMVDVPAGAVGSYTISWDSDQSFLLDETYNYITPQFWTAATIAIPCTTDEQCYAQCEAVCNTATGECVREPDSDVTVCDDGNACTLGDHCVSGECRYLSTVTCNNGNSCYVSGSCNPQTGQCSPPVPKPDGALCSDGNACTLNDVCAQGVCQSGVPRDCTGLPCSEPPCNTTTGQCRPLPNGTACDDGRECTLGDRCLSGTCGPVLLNACSNGDACNHPGSCIPETGECSPPIPKADGTMGCSDNNPCTLVDACIQGVCTGVATLVCTNPCRESTCDPISGQCRPLPNGTSCDDSNECTIGDRCVSGNCAPIRIVQCAGNFCNDAGACIPETGECPQFPKPDGTPCWDADPCTSNQCEQGVCKAEEVPVCIPWQYMVECFWGPAIPTVVDCDELDLNGDGFVDLSDVKLFLESL